MSLLEFVEVLNDEKIGLEIEADLAKRIDGLVEFNLQPRNVSALYEPIMKRIFLDNKKLSPYVKEIVTTSKTSFYDANIGDEFVNIKVVDLSKKNNTCNLNAQGAILYSLTGDATYSEKNKGLSAEYTNNFQYAANYGEDNDIQNDFGFLLLDKSNMKFSSFYLRSMNHIYFNPVKTNWAQSYLLKNLQSPVKRTTKEWIEFISPGILNYTY